MNIKATSNNLSFVSHVLVLFQKAEGALELPDRIASISNGKPPVEGVQIINESAWVIDLNKSLHTFCESITLCRQEECGYSVLFLEDKASFLTS